MIIELKDLYDEDMDEPDPTRQQYLNDAGLGNFYQQVGSHIKSLTFKRGSQRPPTDKFLAQAPNVRHLEVTPNQFKPDLPIHLDTLIINGQDIGPQDPNEFNSRAC